MSRLKNTTSINVLTAARRRISFIFDRFEKIYVSFSAGKDSTVMLNLVGDEARKRGKRFAILFIDWEAQFQLTIEHAASTLHSMADIADIFWVALPMTTENAVSVIEPLWTCWDPEKKDRWVRKLPEGVISDFNHFPFYREKMSFEEFIEEFALWYGKGELTACFVGIRSDESLNRFRTLIQNKTSFNGRRWTTLVGNTTYNAYPIYDWSTEDIWVYHAKTGRPHNKLYDRMHMAGLTIHQMRICEPYGNEARKGLWLFHIIEPDTWPKVANRVAGANSGALYAKEKGNILGNQSISKPKGHTWESYALFLLETMPPKTSEHYKNKIAVYIKYCIDHYDGYENGIPDEASGDTGSKDIPSWRRVCRTILRNDYWCRSLSFSRHKAQAYSSYLNVMKKRREKWKII